MSLPNKHFANDIQHYSHSSSTQSLTSLLPDRHDASQHDKASSYSSDPSLDQRQLNRDLERQSLAPHLRSSTSSPLYQHGRSNSDGKHKNSAQNQVETLQHSFDDLDRFQQQLDLKKAAGDAQSLSAYSFSNHSTTQRRSPLSPSSVSSRHHHIDLSDDSHHSDNQPLLPDTINGYYASLTPPYAECPLVTDDLHLPVPTIIHHFFIYNDNDNDNDDDVGDLIYKEKNTDNNNKTFDTLASQLCPYPFRSRAPLGDRLKRKPPPVEQQDHDMDAAKRYPSLLAQQQREKRHSLGNGQIDRLVHGRKSLLEDDHELSTLLVDPDQSMTLDSSTPTTTTPPSPPPHHQHHHQNDDLLLEDRIHWLTQGYYLVPTSPQNDSPSPPGGHDPPPSLFSSPPLSPSI